MAERLAALGLKPPSKIAEPSQKEERDLHKRNERARQADAADSSKEVERLRRPADENPQHRPAPKPLGKKPPPPPSRGTRSGSLHEKKNPRDPKTDASGEKAKAIRQQQEEQSAQTKELELVVLTLSRKFAI